MLRVFKLELPVTARAPALGRHALDGFNGFLATLRGDMRLLVSELVMNALQHGELDREDAIELDVLQGANTIRVEISNPGPGFRPPEPPRRGARGFGFFFVDQLADRWGVAPDRSQVWFEIDGPRRFWAVAEDADSPAAKPAFAPTHNQRLPG